MFKAARGATSYLIAHNSATPAAKCDMDEVPSIMVLVTRLYTLFSSQSACQVRPKGVERDEILSLASSYHPQEQRQA